MGEKTKMARKCGIENVKGKKKMSLTQRIVNGISSTLVVWINSIIVYHKRIVVLLGKISE